MAYNLYIFAPASDGVASVTASASNGSWSATGTAKGKDSQGNNIPSITRSNVTTGVDVTATFNTGKELWYWVVNVDGTVYTQYSDTCSVGYQSTASNIYIRPETQDAVVTYYAYLSFNANGGSGAPATMYESSDDVTGYVKFTIPSTVPTRSGYTFLGWAVDSSGTGTLRQPGESYTGFGSTSSPGPQHILYAAWKEGTTRYAYIEFNANGGTNAPSSVTGQSETEYVRITIPSTKPTRSGYLFLGWSLTQTATTASYQPSETIDVYGSGTSPGAKYTLFAIWREIGDGCVNIYSGGSWHKAVPYIYSGGSWHQAVPYIYSGGSWHQGG